MNENIYGTGKREAPGGKPETTTELTINGETLIEGVTTTVFVGGEEFTGKIEAVHADLMMIELLIESGEHQGHTATFAYRELDGKWVSVARE